MRMHVTRNVGTFVQVRVPRASIVGNAAISGASGAAAESADRYAKPAA
jgi:hypothetical protein